MLRDKIVPLTGEEKVQQAESRDWNNANTAPLSSEVAVTPIQPAPVIPQKRQTMYDMLTSYGKPYDYAQDIQDAERARKIGLFTDIAGLAGNALTLGLGRRQFANTSSATAQANGYLQRLKDLQRRGEVDYQNSMKNALMRQYMFDREDANRGEERAFRERSYQDNKQYRNEQLSRQQKRDSITDERLKLQREDANKAREFSQDMQRKHFALSAQNAKDNKAYKELLLEAKKTSSSGSKSGADYLIGAGGRKTEFPKSMQGAVAGYLYNRMQEILVSNPKDKRTIVEDTKMQFGEGGDQKSKMLSIVQKRIKDFPELQDELESILGNSTPVSVNKIGWDNAPSSSQTKKIGW